VCTLRYGMFKSVEQRTYVYLSLLISEDNYF
jgi:hypothetical protein